MKRLALVLPIALLSVQLALAQQPAGGTSQTHAPRGSFGPSPPTPFRATLDFPRALHSNVRALTIPAKDRARYQSGQ
jgi:hypothetical protein